MPQSALAIGVLPGAQTKEKEEARNSDAGDEKG